MTLAPRARPGDDDDWWGVTTTATTATRRRSYTATETRRESVFRWRGGAPERLLQLPRVPRQRKRTRGTHARPHVGKTRGTAGTTIRRRDTASLLVARGSAIRSLSFLLSLSRSLSLPRRDVSGDTAGTRDRDDRRAREGGREGEIEGESDIYTRIRFISKGTRPSDSDLASSRLASSMQIGSETITLYSTDMTATVTVTVMTRLDGGGDGGGDNTPTTTRR